MSFEFNLTKMRTMKGCTLPCRHLLVPIINCLSRGLWFQVASKVDMIWQIKCNEIIKKEFTMFCVSSFPKDFGLGSGLIFKVWSKEQSVLFRRSKNWVCLHLTKPVENLYYIDCSKSDLAYRYKYSIPCVSQQWQPFSQSMVEILRCTVIRVVQIR